MTVTREELAAFADGELEPARHAEVLKAIAADPALARQVEAHQALRARLAAHYAPILDEAVPESLRRKLLQDNKVVELAAQRDKRFEAKRKFPSWGWIAGPALAASLVLALLLPRGTSPLGYADPQLSALLDEQLVAAQPSNAPTRILLSFRDGEGAYCRAYLGSDQGGIACKDKRGWHLVETVQGATNHTDDYRRAGSSSALLMEEVQAMADGAALNAEQEGEALDRGWE
jgi:hypothetical protein